VRYNGHLVTDFHAPHRSKRPDSLAGEQWINEMLRISVLVNNTSARVDGFEVCQVYVKRTTQSKVARPVKELKGFEKVWVSAGSSETVHISIAMKDATSVWEETADSWLIESGGYEVLVGSSSALTPLSA
jgi:beta-glucosidase